MNSPASTLTYTFFLVSDVLRATDRSVPAQWPLTATTSSAPQQSFSWAR